MDKNAPLLAEELGWKTQYVDNVIRLLDEGNTVPFIARYRKELHGAMDDQLLRKLAQRLQYRRGLDKRRGEISNAVRDQGKLTPELAAALEQAGTLAELEDLYRPYRPKRRTRASEARERGLEPLAVRLLAQQDREGNLEALAERYVNREKGVATVPEALEGAADIVAELIADDAILRRRLRDLYRRRGVLVSRAAGEEDSVYRGYYDYREPVDRIPGHRVLALNRGEREKFLKVRAELDDALALREIRQRVVRPVSVSNRFVAQAAEEAWKRLIQPSLEREVRGELTQQAAEQAIRTFGDNLRPLLMQPPVRGKVTLGFDPAYRTGCKLAVVDPTGRVLETGVIYPTPPHNKTREARQVLADMIRRHGVQVIAIGNGTASRESERFVSELLEEAPETAYTMVSEAGASVYSASPLGAEEFPDYDVSLRSAVSIARRLQDPLAELVKIDPRSIGVGQYQHDMPSARLDEVLSGVVEDCVNRVGADLNTASASLLEHVAGLTGVSARNIVAYREEHGPYTGREELRKVPRIGPRTFQQCAGFLRVPGGANILDNTGVHPESYPAAEKLLTLCGYTLEDVAHGGLEGLKDRLEAIGVPQAAQACGTGEPTLRDIADELARPGRDPRDQLPPPVLRRDVLDIRDLRPGMALRGTVRNVVDFGAFVDLGLHQDGLIHISQMSSRFIRHPSQVVQVGDVVEVTVLEADPVRGRISLRMKQAEEKD